MPKLQLLHQCTFSGKPLASLRIYNDPFGENEICVELSFGDGQFACIGIGPGRPQIVSSNLCFDAGHAPSANKAFVQEGSTTTPN